MAQVCKGCGWDVLSNSKTCPNCGKSIKGKNLGFAGWFVVIFGILTVSFIISQIGDLSSPNKSMRTTGTNYARLSNIERLISESKTHGYFMKVDYSLNRVEVDPTIWRALPLSAKENTCIAMAEYCGIKKDNGLNWVEIYDGYSGKKLAKYGSWGFKVYD